MGGGFVLVGLADGGEEAKDFCSGVWIFTRLYGKIAVTIRPDRLPLIDFYGKEVYEMKRILAFVLLMTLCAAALCACGQNDPAPTEEPTASLTEAPAAALTEAPTEPETQAPPMADPSWFDDAVFVGDSITSALDYFCAADPDMLGYAQFVCADSLSYHNALWDIDNESAVHPTYQGETVLAESAAEITGARKIFIMMGVNDIGTYGADDTMECAAELAQRILLRSPDVQIYFQSTTPMVAEQESGWLNNGKIQDFNAQLKAYCEENGYHYIDLYHQLCDESGALRVDYCSDPDGQGIHFNTDGCTVWVNYLRTVAADGQ